jgi:hypothetical protein
LGTVKLAPVYSNVPPQLPEYHFQLAPVPKIPGLPVPYNCVCWPRQIGLPILEVIDPGGTVVSFTVIKIEAQTVELQVPEAFRK